MITAYYKDTHTGAIMTQEVDAPPYGLPDNVLWVDVQKPSAGLDAVAEQLGIDLPTKTEVWKNHALNRLYVEDGNAYMTAAIITKVESPYPGTSPVTFILTPKCLLTVHEIDPTSFRNFAARLQKPNEHFSTSAEMLEGLFEEMIIRVAHNSELILETLDEISHNIFGAVNGTAEPQESSSHLMKDILARLGAAADLNSKINESLHTFNRALLFFKRVVPGSTRSIDTNIDLLVADVNVLLTQTSFVSDKITFQLDATLGMINVEQNLIIKIFSVVAVFFMPPTLVSSIYGMNFHHMPELEWLAGYPMAIVLMLTCAIVPYVYFRKRGWL